MGVLPDSHQHKLMINYSPVPDLPAEYGVNRSKNSGVDSRQTDRRTDKSKL